MYACMYVFMYACMYVCMYVCMHVCTYVLTYASTYARLYTCTYVRMYVCTYVCMYACTYALFYVCVYACMHLNEHTYAYVCIYFIYIHLQMCIMHPCMRACILNRSPKRALRFSQPALLPKHGLRKLQALRAQERDDLAESLVAQRVHVIPPLHPKGQALQGLCPFPKCPWSYVVDTWASRGWLSQQFGAQCYTTLVLGETSKAREYDICSSMLFTASIWCRDCSSLGGKHPNMISGMPILRNMSQSTCKYPGLTFEATPCPVTEISRSSQRALESLVPSYQGSSHYGF